eukprot:SAG31_NODE_26549_length_440_cov_1.017595_1_plen_69_part_10
METVVGWHGTGTFPAEKIYNDRLDGFMMQFASEGGFPIYSCERKRPYVSQWEFRPPTWRPWSLYRELHV